MASIDQIRKEARHYSRTKRELLESYEKEFGARQGRGQLLDRIVYETGASRRSVERRFNPDRIDKPVRRIEERELYEQLGRELEPTYTANENGYLVDIKGEVRISKKCFYREFSVYLDGDAAQYFVESGDMSILTGAYFNGDQSGEAFYADDRDVMREDISEGFCGIPHIDVLSI